MTKSQIRKYAFIKSIPIMCSYIFVSMAYGIMMEDAGFKWYYSLLVSMTVYTGAFQFVLITFLSSGASVITVALTALLMNSRQSFYSLTFLEDFKKMGKRMLYMIHTMTDETYAVNCTLELPQKEKEDAIFIDQWEKTDKHTPALAGCGIGIICLLIFGASSFMLPALLITSGLLVVLQKKGEEA